DRENEKKKPHLSLDEGRQWSLQQALELARLNNGHSPCLDSFREGLKGTKLDVDGTLAALRDYSKAGTDWWMKQNAYQEKADAYARVRDLIILSTACCRTRMCHDPISAQNLVRKAQEEAGVGQDGGDGRPAGNDNEGGEGASAQ